MSKELKKNIQRKCYAQKHNNTYKKAVIFLSLILVIGITACTGYYISDRIWVNKQVLPELDDLKIVSMNKLKDTPNQYGWIDLDFKDYNQIKDKLGIPLLDSELSKDNPYLLGNLHSDNKDCATIRMDYYIIGDTKNFNYLPDEHRYEYTQGDEYKSPISIEIDITLSEEQLNIGWSVDYLGMYDYVETFYSKQGYKVNIIEDTIGGEHTESFVSRKCAIFVADGIQYTLEGKVSLEKMKEIIDSMTYN